MHADLSTYWNEPAAGEFSSIQRLLELFRLADPDIDRIVELIEQHPRLRAETLRRSNSVYLGLPRTMDVFDAVNRLGFYEVYGIVADLHEIQRGSAPRRLVAH